MKNISRELKNLFWVQFLGALNDNIFKNALVIMVTYQGINLFGLNSKMLVAFAGGVFILPFILFSAFSGELSNKYDRIQIMRWVKILEILIMLAAGMGIFLSNYYLLFFVLFLLGVHSTFFGPIKYSLIPDYSTEENIVFSNAIISAGTFIAILLGTLIGGVLAGTGEYAWGLKFVMIVFAVIGTYCSFKLPNLNPTQPELDLNFRPILMTKKVFKMMTSDREVFSLLLGLSWFWFLGAGILSLVPTLAHDIFKAQDSVATLLLFIFTLGMGLGPFIFEKLAKGKIIHQMIPISLFIMSFFLFDVAFVVKQIINGNFLPPVFETLTLKQFMAVRYSYRILIDLFCVSFFGGIFTVLQFSELQLIVEKNSLSQIMAGNNILNALFMVTVSILIMILYKLEFNLAIIFGIIGILNIGAGITLAFFHRHEFDKWWSFE